MADPKIPADLQAKLDNWNKKAAAKSGQPADVATAVHSAAQLLATTSALLGQNDARTEKLASLLEGMVGRVDKKLGGLQPITIPDQSGPIVKALSELKASIAKVGDRPVPTIDIPTPQVTVAAPDIDTRGVERLLKNDLPKAFREAIDRLQFDFPANDFTPLEARLDAALVILRDIETASRLKPEPGVIKVTNPDGSAIGSAGGGSSTANQGTGAAQGISWRVMGDYTEVTGLTAGSLSADLLPVMDVSAYKWFSLHVMGTFSGTLTFQASNDGTSFVSYNVAQVNQGTATTISASGTSNQIFNGAVHARYLRVRMTSYTSGTATGVAEFYTLPSQFQSIGVTATQTGNWTMLRGSLTATILAAAAQTASGNSAALTTVGPYESGLVTLNCTAASGTTPTLNVKIQVSDDGGTTWYDLAGASFIQLTGTGSQAISIGGNTSSFGTAIRASYTIAGTTPSFTFAVKGVFTS